MRAHRHGHKQINNFPHRSTTLIRPTEGVSYACRCHLQAEPTSRARNICKLALSKIEMHKYKTQIKEADCERYDDE